MRSSIKTKILGVFFCFCGMHLCIAQSDNKKINRINLREGIIIVEMVEINNKHTPSIFLAKSTSDNATTNFDNVIEFANQINIFYSSEIKRKLKVNNALKGWDCWLEESGIIIYAKKINLRVHLDVEQSLHLAKLILESDE